MCVRAQTNFIKALANFARPEDLPLLRELAKDQNSNVRAVAINALASFARPEDLSLLRELAKDQNSNVRAAAMKALASFEGPEDLPLLRELAKGPELGCARGGDQCIGKFCKVCGPAAATRTTAKHGKQESRL
jgi:HEAT repeat protein